MQRLQGKITSVIEDQRTHRYRGLLREYLGRRKMKMLLLACLACSSIGVQVVGPLLLSAFVDDAQSDETLNVLFVIAFAFISISFLQMFLGAIEAYVSADIAMSSTNELREDLTRRLLELGGRFYDEIHKVAKYKIIYAGCTKCGNHSPI